MGKSDDKLRVYSVSFFNGDEIIAGVYEDLDQANSILGEFMAQFGDEDPWNDEYDDLAESIVLGKWRGEPTYIVGREGICSIHAFRAGLKLG